MTEFNRYGFLRPLEFVYAHVFRFMRVKGRFGSGAADFVAAGFVTLGVSMVAAGILVSLNAFGMPLYGSIMRSFIDGSPAVKLAIVGAAFVLYVSVEVLLGPRAKQQYKCLLSKPGPMWPSYFIGIAFLVVCGLFMFVGAELGRSSL